MSNRLNWTPPAIREPSRPAKTRRSGTSRPKADPFPVPDESLNKLAESIPPGEARLVLAPGADEEAFRQAFGEVWSQIPGADRHRLLKYWREDDTIDRHNWRNKTRIPPKPRPNLLLVADSEIAERDCECRDDAHVLAFRASLTTSNRERLRPAMATALAQAYGTITKVFTGLLIELYDSFDPWRKANPNATEEEWDQAWQPLADDYTRKYWKETNAILQRWGFPTMEKTSR